jgi:hypothetical protein
MKWSHFGLAAAFTAVLMGGTAAAQAPVFKVSKARGQATLTAAAGDFRFVESLTPTTFDITVVRGADAVRVTGNANSEVQVRRGARARNVNLTLASNADSNAVRAMLADSPALNALEAFSESTVAKGSQYAPVLRAAVALLAMLRGETAATLSLARSMAPASSGLVSVAAPSRASDCWDGYARSVVRYTYELEGCLREARDNPWQVWRPHWCGTEYDLKVLLAGYWLLTCSGVDV